ncbi:MAG: uridine kinase [Gammaproteobacteria bacterium]|nr:uridine kinase [Gammaproteobacteria bacterium]
MQTAIIGIDGCGGAGKSTFASLLSELLDDCAVIRTDDFASWEVPLDWYPRMLEQVLVPLSENLPAHFQRYDWPTSQLAEWQTVFPQAFVVIEGVSATRKEFKRFLAFSIYIETDRETRLSRGLRRDGEETKHQWLGWMRHEDSYLERDDPISSADLIISGNPTCQYDYSKGIVVLVP